MTNTHVNPNPNQPTTSTANPDPAKVYKAVAKRSFATLATCSPAGFPHVAGVLYEVVGKDFYLNTMADSRKARNASADGRVAMTIPIRRVPFGGPPSTVHFQAKATVLSPHSEEIQSLVAAGKLKSITSHGELELDGSCFIKVSSNRTWLAYGLGMSLLKLIKDPLNASGRVEVVAD